MTNDNMSVFLFTLTKLSEEHGCTMEYSNDYTDRIITVRFYTDTRALFGQIIAMCEHIDNSAFPATYAKSLFRQMMKKHEA